MAKRSARMQELREKTESSCIWGLFNILDSHQVRASPKLISNGRTMNKHIIDHPGTLDQLASFDEECQKIQNEADLASGTVYASERTRLRNLIRDDIYIEKHKNKEIVARRQQLSEADSKLVDHLVETHKTRRKQSQKAYQSSICNAASLIHQQPAAEIPNKLTLAAMLGTVGTQNLQEETRLSEGFRRSICPGKHDQNEINMQQARMSAKAFVDQTFNDRKFIRKEGTSSEPKPFSNALEVLYTNKDVFMELLPEPNSLLARQRKNFHPSQTGKEIVKLVSDAKFSKCESKEASTYEKPGCRLATDKGNMNNQPLGKINYQCECSNTSFTAQPSDKILILERAPQNGKYHTNVACNCSSRQSHQKLSGQVSNGKPTSLSLREVQKKLTHTFGGTRRKPNQLSMNGTLRKLSYSRSIFGDGCICQGVDARNPLNSPINAETKEKLGKKHDLKSNGRAETACLTDTVREKIDISSVKLIKKQEFDLVLEAKRQLSARLRNLNAVGVPPSRTSSKTLGRILSRPEFWSLSPGRDSQYCSGSAQRIFSPYISSPSLGERIRTCHLSPLRTNLEVTSCDDYKKYGYSIEILSTEKSSSPIRTTDKKAYDTIISANDHMKSKGEPKIVETNSIQHSEVPSDRNSNDVTSTMQITEATESHEKEGSAMHSILDSLSENETCTSTVDDFPSSPTSAHQLDIPESMKYQEHQSPVSVLEHFFAEDANSPSGIMLQNDRRQLKPVHLHFEECSLESSSLDPTIRANACMDEQDYISHYVHVVLQSSCLDWDQLSKTGPLSEEPLHPSLFDEVKFLSSDSHFDPRLLFDHMNQVLLEIRHSHFCFPLSLAFIKQKVSSVPLEELVLDEIMKEADFYLLPRSEKRTLDQLVAKDVTDCRSWPPVRLETENIMIHISEDILEELIQFMLLESQT